MDVLLNGKLYAYSRHFQLQILIDNIPLAMLHPSVLKMSLAKL